MAGEPRGADESPRAVRPWLHLDGVAVLAAAITGYAISGGRWWLFAALLFAPDLFMLGYLANAKTGAIVYNVGHTYLVPGIVLAVGLLTGAEIVARLAIIWIAHIGLDRVFGYGFKYPSGFAESHYRKV